MQMIKLPLSQTEDENRAILAASEARLQEQGDFDGNRAQRRRAARHERRLRRREKAKADE